MKTTKLILGFIFFTNILYSQDYQDFKFYDIGLEQMNNNRYSEAIYFFNRAINLNPENSIYFLNRGYCYFNIEDYKNALNDFVLCSKMIPDEEQYYYLSGLCYGKLDNCDSAIILYNKAIEMNNRNYEYFYHRGIVYMKVDSIAKSISDFDNSIKLNPGQSSSYFNRGQSKFKLKMTESAFLDWEIAMLLDSSLIVKQYDKNFKGKFLGVWKDLDSLSKSFKYEEPNFQGGDFANFSRFVALNVNYPPASLLNGQQGRTISKFIVSARGEIIDFKTISSVSKSIDNEVKRVIESTKCMWTGGKINGIPADFEYTFQIPFFDISTLEKIKMLGDKADKALIKQDYNTALDFYNDIIKIDSLDLNTLRKRSTVNIMLGNKSDAENDWEIINNLNVTKFKLNPLIVQNIDDYSSKDGRTVTVFYDSLWHVTSKNKANYYRISKWSDHYSFFNGDFQDYFLDGNEFANGKYVNFKKEGTYNSYFKNGRIKINGRFNNNELDSIWTEFFENGTKKIAVEIINGDFNILELYDSIGNNLMSNDLFDFKLNFNDNYELIGSFLKRKRNGKWSLNLNGKLVLDEIYKNGIYKKGIYYSDNQKYYPTENHIKAWLFLPSYLITVENLIFDNDEIQSDYKYIKTQNSQ